MGVLATDWPDNPVQDERQLCLYYRTPASGTCISLSAAPRWEFASLTCARAHLPPSLLPASLFSPHRRVFRRALAVCTLSPRQRTARRRGIPAFRNPRMGKGRRTEGGYPWGRVIHEGEARVQNRRHRPSQIVCVAHSATLCLDRVPVAYMGNMRRSTLWCFLRIVSGNYCLIWTGYRWEESWNCVGIDNFMNVFRWLGCLYVLVFAWIKVVELYLPVPVGRFYSSRTIVGFK